MNRYRVRIDPTRCCGTSNCAEAAPEAYEVDERCIPSVRTPLADDDALLRGAQACPMDAIEVTDIATGRRIHPT